MDNKFRSRKFMVAIFFTLSGTVGLFMDKLGGGEYIALATTVLTLYGLANVADKKVS